MPRKRKWVIDGVEVNMSDVRRWMQSVAWRTPTRNYWSYIKLWDVPGKIARAKARGTFERTIAEAARDAGVKVRAAKRPNKNQSLRHWRLRAAANDSTFSQEETVATPSENHEKTARLNR